jgi:hypothetical protein
LRRFIGRVVQQMEFFVSVEARFLTHLLEAVPRAGSDGALRDAVVEEWMSAHK